LKARWRIGAAVTHSATKAMGEIVVTSVNLEQLEPMISLNAEHRESLVKRAGGVLSAAEVGSLLQITHLVVDERRTTGALLAIKRGSDWLYPRCQFAVDETVPGIEEVVRGIGSAGPWVTLDFLLAPDEVLGGLTPLAALSRGGEMREMVMRLVRSEVADGFS
jgi:hypothetical protein